LGRVQAATAEHIGDLPRFLLVDPVEGIETVRSRVENYERQFSQMVSSFRISGTSLSMERKPPFFGSAIDLENPT
jgi:hypothetical protein